MKINKKVISNKRRSFYKIQPSYKTFFVVQKQEQKEFKEKADDLLFIIKTAVEKKQSVQKI